MVQRTLEEHLYWAIVYSRWLDKKGFKLFTTPLIEMMGFPIGHFVIWKVKREVTRELFYQGLGRHKEEEMYALCIDDLKAICHKLGDKPYYFGEKPSTIDACIYAHFASILYQPWQTPLNDYLVRQHYAIAYSERMANAYFSDLDMPKPFKP